MLSVQQLKHLQTTLSKSERRYFRLLADMQGGAKSYLALFDWLDSQPMLIPADVLARDWPPTRLEPARKHLGRVLLRSLRLFAAGHDTEAKLADMLHEARLLLQRGLIEAGLVHLQRIKELARQTEQPGFVVRAIKLELQRAVLNQFTDYTEADLLVRHGQIQQALSEQESLFRHTKLYELLLLRYQKNGPVRLPAERVQLNDLLLEEYAMMNQIPTLLTESERLHRQFQAVYFSMIGDYEGSISLLKQVADYYEQLPQLNPPNQYHYLTFLDGLLRDLRNAGQLSAMPHFLHRLDMLINRVSGNGTSSRYISFFHRLSYLTDTNQRVEAHALLQLEATALLRGIPGLAPTLQADLCIIAARLLRERNEPKMALAYLNEILNERTGLLPWNKYNQARLLSIMVQFDRPDREYLMYALISLERKLRQGEHYYATERAVVEFIRGRLVGKRTPSLPERLDELSQTPSEREVILMLGLRQWAIEHQR